MKRSPPRGVLKLAHPAQHHELAILLQIARIARMQPAIGQRAGGRRIAAAVAVEHARRADEDLACPGDADFDARQRMSHGMQPHRAVALGGGQRAILALPIELLQVEAEAAEIEEGVLADGLARRVAALGAGKPQVVLDRAIDQRLAYRLPDLLQRGWPACPRGASSQAPSRSA